MKSLTEQYSKYSKTKIGNFLCLKRHETNSWIIFDDLTGEALCTCDDGELDATLKDLEATS